MTNAIGRSKTGLREWRVMGEKMTFEQRCERSKGGKPWVKLDRRNENCKVQKWQRGQCEKACLPRAERVEWRAKGWQSDGKCEPDQRGLLDPSGDFGFYSGSREQPLGPFEQQNMLTHSNIQWAWVLDTMLCQVLEIQWWVWRSSLPSRNSQFIGEFDPWHHLKKEHGKLGTGVAEKV